MTVRLMKKEEWKEYVTTKELRSGELRATTGEVLVTKKQHLAIVKNYITYFHAHGVKSFCYCLQWKGRGKHKGEVYTAYIRATRSLIERNPERFYTWNATGTKELSLCFRPDNNSIAWLLDNCEIIKRVDLEEWEAETTEINQGYKAEVLLYGRSQKRRTFSDGKSPSPSGKLENSQLKASCYNSSGSRSKSHDIWLARAGVPEE